MLNGRYRNDTRILRDSENAISNFWRAATLLDSSITHLEIPYDGHVKLPAYLHIPHHSKRLPGKLPLLVNTVGADATQEEIFYIFPMAAVELGYAVLTFINTFLAGGFAPDPLWDRFLGLLKWWDVQTRWESDLTCWMLGVDSAAAMFHRMMQFSFATADGKGFLHKVKCPVFVTGARFSLYCQPEISTMRIYNELVNVPEDKKVAWVGEDAGEGGLQSKVGAFGVLNQKAFAFLDNVI